MPEPAPNRISSMTSSSFRRSAAALLILLAGAAVADEAAIRKNLPERLPSFPKIDEVSKTPIPGLYEARLGTDIVYSDATGNPLTQGAIIDTRSKTARTRPAIDKLAAIHFASLPLKNAVVIKQ